MGDFGTNGAEVRGSACGCPEAGHKEKGKAAEVRFMASGDNKNITPGSGDTSAPYIFGQDTGDRGGVGGPTAIFLRLC